MSSERQALGEAQIIGHPALTDPETGLANQLHFELLFRYLFLAGDRGMAFTIMLLSVGEPGFLDAEPERRAEVARTVQSTTRLADLVAVVDRDRFAGLLLGSNLSGARIAADRIESALRAATSAPVAIGLAAFRADMTEAAALLAAADGARVAAAKAGGGVEMA